MGLLDFLFKGKKKEEMVAGGTFKVEIAQYRILEHSDKIFFAQVYNNEQKDYYYIHKYDSGVFFTFIATSEPEESLEDAEKLIKEYKEYLNPIIHEVE